MQMPENAAHDRLYQGVARRIIAELTEGKYPAGSRLPAERELALQYNVSRPTIREAIISLEVQGLVEVRIGSGAYVLRLPGSGDIPGFNLTAFELTEARLLFEGEAAALAATEASDHDIREFAQLIEEIARENHNPRGTDRADRAFHLAIARATRNGAVFDAIENLWELRAKSPESALLHAKARSANIKPVVEEHTRILRAIESRDPNSARAAMRAHLSAVLDSLLFAPEDQTTEQAGKSIDAKRARYRVVAD